MKKIGSFALCVAILSVGLPASGDTKSIHAAICKDGGGVGSIGYSASEGITGTGGAQNFVTCPLIRDRVNSSTSLDSVVVEVYIPSGGSIECTLYSQDEDGNLGGVVDSDYQERSTQGIGQLTFNVASSSGNEGTYGLFCDLSNSVSVYHIYMNENTATD
jgi:hypothetical protein